MKLDEFLRRSNLGDNPEEVMKKALSLKKQKKFDEAINEFTYVIISDPSHVDAFCHRALCYYGQYNFDCSIFDCTKALTLTNDPYKMDMLYEIRSRSHIKQENYDQAFLDLNKSCDLYPSDAFEKRANLYVEKKDYQNALKDFEQMFLFYPNNGFYPFKIGLCYYSLSKYKKSQEYFVVSAKLGFMESLRWIDKAAEHIKGM